MINSCGATLSSETQKTVKIQQQEI